MRAVKGSLGHSLNERYRESEDAQREINPAPSLRDNEQAWWNVRIVRRALTGLTRVPCKGSMGGRMRTGKARLVRA